MLAWGRGRWAVTQKRYNDALFTTQFPFPFFFPDILGFIAATEYLIVDTKTTWIEADELCKSNGSILALLDSQPKINELAERLKSLGYKNSDKFWIGLTFNVTIGQFVLSNGTKAGENLDSLTCGKKKPGGNHNHYCYILKDIDNSSSPCISGKNCQDKKYGYICQNSSTGKVLNHSYSQLTG